MVADIGPLNYWLRLANWKHAENGNKELDNGAVQHRDRRNKPDNQRTVRASMSPDSSVTKDQIVLISMQRISSTPPSVASKTEPAPNFKLESRDRRLMHHQPNGDADRRFPPPWSADVTTNCFIVRDANGQAPSYTTPSIRRS